MNNKTMAITRLIVLLVLLLNQALVTLGYNPLPFSDEQVYEAVSSVLTVIVAIYTWYKNNDTTDAAVAGTAVTKELKHKPLSAEEAKALSKVKR